MKSDSGNGDESIIQDIVKAIRSIRYGYVQVIIQDSRVIQIDKTEKNRLNKKVLNEVPPI